MDRPASRVFQASEITGKDNLVELAGIGHGHLGKEERALHQRSQFKTNRRDADIGPVDGHRFNLPACGLARKDVASKRVAVDKGCWQR